MEDAQPPKAHREELFDDLERMLREQIAFNPGDLKLRVRLAGLYFERGREAEFLNEAKALRDAMRGNLDSPDWRQIAIIGRRIAPHSPIFDSGSPEADNGKQRRLGEGKREQALFQRLTEQYAHLRADPDFLRSVDKELIFSANRPSSLLHAKRYSAHNGGAQILIKREDLMMRGAALITAITGQVMLAKRLGCKTVVTGTVYGQKGIVMASVAARLGLDAVVYMDGEQAHQRGIAPAQRIERDRPVEGFGKGWKGARERHPGKEPGQTHQPHGRGDIALWPREGCLFRRVHDRTC